MLIYLLAAAALLVFVIGVSTDLRRFSNAVSLGAFLGLLGVALIGELRTSRGPLLTYAASTLIVLAGAAVLLLCSCLIANGVQMVRKEGRRPANLLSLLTGVAVLSVVGLLFLAMVTGSRPLAIVTGITVLTTVYFAFLFACYVLYGSFYGGLRVRADLDYIVVLGSGLLGGDRVPPLLASRLDKAGAVYSRQAARGRAPVVITSGGQGPDETVPEAHAMAAYLTGRGLPEAHIRREARSRTTEENLRFSKAIMEQTGTDYRCVIVTNDFHAFRAALLARATGVRGHALGSPTAAYFRPSATIREFVAVILSHRTVNAAACVLLAQQCWVTLW
ncbi:YdcF family protein [Streptomyces sp. YS415]|uniref:YdcF family protein n=1 Tax=Streptomyces sp. YS415 TaxID=2944806 RepID=UPI0020226B66|nr:YdcF family protein [Streptomyces sp. YS415]MCL7429400.1 YdcF family protein [Streptomyces sp. YS415]